MPFTRAYPPGHAKLKTRWQFYLLGMWAIAYLPIRMEQQVLNDPWGFVVLLMKGVAVLGVLEIAGRSRACKWTMPPDSECDDADPEPLTFLNLGPRRRAQCSGRAEALRYHQPLTTNHSSANEPRRCARGDAIDVGLLGADADTRRVMIWLNFR